MNGAVDIGDDDLIECLEATPSLLEFKFKEPKQLLAARATITTKVL